MLDSFVILAPLLLLPVVALLRFVGCESFDSKADVVTVTPDTATLGPGESQQFTASVNGTPPSTNVTWSANAQPNGYYKAPDPFDPGGAHHDNGHQRDKQRHGDRQIKESHSECESLYRRPEAWSNPAIYGGRRRQPEPSRDLDQCPRRSLYRPHCPICVGLTPGDSWSQESC